MSFHANALSQASASPETPGRFVVVEGPDGSGKTDAVRGLIDFLHNQGIRTVSLREPGGTVLGEQLRTILKNPDATICDRAELLLFCAARAQTVEENILPSLANGIWVISDRWEPSSVIYQGLARGLGEQTVMELSKFARGDVEPDYMFTLQVASEIARQRKSQRGEPEGSRISARLSTEVIRQGYSSIPERHPDTIVVDANGTRENTLAAIVAVLKADLN